MESTHSTFKTDSAPVFGPSSSSSKKPDDTSPAPQPQPAEPGSVAALKAELEKVTEQHTGVALQGVKEEAVVGQMRAALEKMKPLVALQAQITALSKAMDSADEALERLTAKHDENITTRAQNDRCKQPEIDRRLEDARKLIRDFRAAKSEHASVSDNLKVLEEASGAEVSTDIEEKKRKLSIQMRCKMEVVRELETKLKALHSEAFAVEEEIFVKRAEIAALNSQRHDLEQKLPEARQAFLLACDASWFSEAEKGHEHEVLESIFQAAQKIVAHCMSEQVRLKTLVDAKKAALDGAESLEQQRAQKAAPLQQEPTPAAPAAPSIAPQPVTAPKLQPTTPASASTTTVPLKTQAEKPAQAAPKPTHSKSATVRRPSAALLLLAIAGGGFALSRLPQMRVLFSNAFSRLSRLFGAKV